MTEVETPAASAFAGGPNDWNRWGPDDNVGRANLLTPDAVLDAATSIRTGKRFSLALPLCSPEGDPAFPGQPPSEHHMRQDASHYQSGKAIPRVGGMQHTDDVVTLPCHGTTHMDALGHAFADGTLWNGYSASTTVGGLSRASIGHLAEHGFVGRAVLADVARHEGVTYLGSGRQITLAELCATLDAQEAIVRPGDTLIIRTGALGTFYDLGPDAYYEVFDEPGIGWEQPLIDFLVDNDIAGLGSDTLCNERSHSGDHDVALPLHVLLQRDRGIIFHEALWLEDWAADCALDEEHDAFYVAAPLRIAQGSGGPMNPIVIK